MTQHHYSMRLKTAVSIVLMSSSAIAADSTQLQEVVVTGTSIRGVAAVGSPTVEMDRDAIAATGLATGGDLARSLPQVLSLGADESRLAGSQDAAANTTRTSAINLRGIGNEATLLLLNGRRLAPNGVIKALYDPNQIPQSAVQKMEVVVDGASAVYGSDAVAGVVNIITRRDFNGAETTGRYGWADGLDQTTLSQTFGQTWDGGSAFIALEYYNRSRLNGSERDFATQDRRARGGSDSRSTLASPGNIAITAAGVTTRYPLPAGSGVGIPPASLVAGPANRFDEGTFADLLPQQTRRSALVNVYQDITESIELYYEGFFTRHEFSERVAPASGTLSVRNTNPFYVSPATVVPAPNPIPVEYRFLTEDRDPKLFGEEDSQQHALGMRWNIGGEWQLNGYVAYNKDEGFQIRGAITNSNTLTCALAGAVPCVVPAGTVANVGAFNAFGNGTTNSAALNSLIIAHRDTYAVHIGKDFGVKADGPLFDLSGGSVRLAVGAEYYDTSFEQELWASNVTLDNTLKLKPVSKERDVKSLFAELYVPLVSEANAMTGIQKLDLSLAARYDEYSSFGDTTNPKLGLVYSPIDSLTFSASYGTSFRAPSLVDTAVDPNNPANKIHNIFIQNITDPTAAAPGFITRGIYHNGARADLKPEEATTWSAGLDWRPSFLEGFKLGATYYNIDYTDRIDVVLNTALTNEAVYAPFIIRNPTPAQVAVFMNDPDLQSPVEALTNIKVIIDGRRANLGRLLQDGVDLDLSYTFDTGVGTWGAALNVAKILNLTRNGAPGLPMQDVLDTFGNPVDIRMRANLSWRNGGWSANVFANRVGGYTNTAITPSVPVDSLVTIDASASYVFETADTLFNGMSINLSGQNVLDEEPPIVLNGTFSWDNQNASAIGRFFAVGITKRW